jgi:hypothetical protein
MPNHFKAGDHVRWNSEAGYVSGMIIKGHSGDFNYKGYTPVLRKTIRNMKLKVIRQNMLPRTKEKR